MLHQYRSDVASDASSKYVSNHCFIIRLLVGKTDNSPRQSTFWQLKYISFNWRSFLRFCMRDYLLPPFLDPIIQKSKFFNIS